MNSIIRIRLILIFTVLIVCSTPLVMSSNSPRLGASVREEANKPSVTCIEKLGLTGTVTGNILVKKLADDGSEIVFVGTSDGLYIISEGALIQYIYTPFGISHIATIDDVTGDGNRDIVVSFMEADVASIRCYESTTWEEIWQFAPRQQVFVDDMGWSDLQLSTADMEIIGTGNTQIIAVSTGQCVFSINPRDGKRLWKFEAMHELSKIAEVLDIDDDGKNELVVGDNAGYIYMLSGRTGQVDWKHKVSEDQSDEHGTFYQFSITDLVSFDRDDRKMIAAAEDGKIRLIDLYSRDIEWGSQVFLRGDTSEKLNITITLVSDTADDSCPDILAASEINEGRPRLPTPFGLQDSNSLEVALIGGIDGNTIWLDQLYLQSDSRIEIAYQDGQKVILELGKEGKIRFVDLETGQIIGSMDATNYSRSSARIKQLADYSYLLVSNDSGLNSLSFTGTVQWSYPRITGETVQMGEFTGNTVLDLLVYGEMSPPEEAISGIVSLSVVDGATYERTWFYQVPYSDFASLGGLQGVHVATDLTGDRSQDILAYRGASVFIFNGADGSPTQHAVDNDVIYLQGMKVGADTSVVLVATEEDIIIVNAVGDQLWKSAYTDWGDVDAVWSLEDLNDDDISDLAIILSNQVIVATSDSPSPLEFTIDLSVPVTGDKIVSPFELIDDIDGDGVSEIAYFECDEEDKALFIISPISGNIMLELSLNNATMFDLACADFNGDGFVDSLVYWADQQRLQIFSGENGSSIFIYDYTDDVKSKVNKLPAVPVTDVTGDGISDLAISMIVDSHRQVLVYDITTDLPVKQIVLPYPQQYNHELSSPLTGSSAPGRGICSVGDLNGDTYEELAILDMHSMGTVTRKYHIGLIDVYGEQFHAYFPFSDLNLFDTVADSMQGIATNGGIYLMNYNGGIQVTLPTSDSITGSPASIAWEGAGLNDFTEVFVDNIRHTMISGTGTKLSLAKGKHQAIIRSIDESGKITYATISFSTRASSWAPVISFIMMALLLPLFFYSQWARFRRNRRAWKGMSDE